MLEQSDVIAQQGYKHFVDLIDFAISTNNERLLVEIKEFIRNNPDYQLKKEQKTYLDVN